MNKKWVQVGALCTFIMPPDELVKKNAKLGQNVQGNIPTMLKNQASVVLIFPIFLLVFRVFRPFSMLIDFYSIEPVDFDEFLSI